MSIFEDLNAGKYDNPISFVRRKDDPTEWQRYRDEAARRERRFHDDLLAELGVADNPKAELLYSKAWEMGHSSGFSEVATVAFDLADLIREEA